MNKNYYDILQVNKNASPEIIEKAYKTLAKKYHPDLQTEQNKKQFEEILKEMNEAYEILSDPEKKENYDKIQQQISQPEQQYEQVQEDKINQEKLYQEQLRYQQELDYQNQLQQAKQKAYYDAYIQDLKNRGYKIRYPKTLKDYIRGIICILIVILVLFLLYQLPFVKSFFANLYKENDLIHWFVDFVSKIFKN